MVAHLPARVQPRSNSLAAWQFDALCYVETTGIDHHLNTRNRRLPATSLAFTSSRSECSLCGNLFAATPGSLRNVNPKLANGFLDLMQFMCKLYIKRPGLLDPTLEAPACTELLNYDAGELLGSQPSRCPLSAPAISAVLKCWSTCKSPHETSRS